MSRRRKIAIAVVLAAVLAALLYLYLRSRQEVDYAFPEPSEPTPVATQPSGLPSTGGTSAPVTTQPEEAAKPVPPTPEEDAQAEIRRLAAAFAEKFGSYSSLSDYDNILDLKVFMTDSMARWADSYVADARAKRSSSTVPYGTTTRSLVTDLESFSEAGPATVMVTTQREEVSGNPGEETRKVYYQDMKVDFIKSGDSWRINGAYWQKQ
jgi:hypothetical protein